MLASVTLKAEPEGHYETPWLAVQLSDGSLLLTQPEGQGRSPGMRPDFACLSCSLAGDFSLSASDGVCSPAELCGLKDEGLKQAFVAEELGSGMRTCAPGRQRSQITLPDRAAARPPPLMQSGGLLRS